MQYEILVFDLHYFKFSKYLLYQVLIFNEVLLDAKVVCFYGLQRVSTDLIQVLLVFLGHLCIRETFILLSDGES